MNTRRLCIALSGLLLLTACATATDHVIFVTKTSLGLNVDSTPAGASFAYDRVEGFIGPRFEDGSIPPVAGSLSTNGKLFDRDIKQVYATGKAALIATGAVKPRNPADGAEDKTPSKEVYRTMFFGTSTVLGLQLGFAPTGIDNMVLGYKRKEISVIPISTTGFPSVLSMLETDVPAAARADSELGLSQFFATGTAADQLAGLPAVRRAFEDRVKTSTLARYDEDEHEQNLLTIGTLACLARVDDARLNEVWTSADALVFRDARVLAQLRARAPRDARAYYTKYLAIPRARSSEMTASLRSHEGFVCGLAPN